MMFPNVNLQYQPVGCFFEIWRKDHAIRTRTKYQGCFTKEEKGEIIREITQVFARMKSEEFAGGTWVVVSEIDGGCWGEGGEVLDADHVPESSVHDAA